MYKTLSTLVLATHGQVNNSSMLESEWRINSYHMRKFLIFFWQFAALN